MKPIAPKKAVAQNDANRAAPCEGKDAAPNSPARSLFMMGNPELGRVISWRIPEIEIEPRTRSIVIGEVARPLQRRDRNRFRSIVFSQVDYAGSPKCR